MKKIVFGMIVAAVVSFTAAAAFSWDLPTKVPTSAGDVKDIAGTKAIETALNQKLKDANCTFVEGTTQVKGCDLKKIGQELAVVYKGAKESANYRVYVNIEAADAKAAGKKVKSASPVTGYERADKVKADLRTGLGGALSNSWNYNTKKNDSLGDRVALSVSVEK